jgi:hypothetical protein
VGYQLNDRAAALIMQLVRGKTSYEEARKELLPRKMRKQPTECRVGAHGVCQTHGQISSDCEKDQ